MQPQLDSRNCLNIFVLYDPVSTAVLMSFYLLGDAFWTVRFRYLWLV